MGETSLLSACLEGCLLEEESPRPKPGFRPRMDPRRARIARQAQVYLDRQ